MPTTPTRTSRRRLLQTLAVVAAQNTLACSQPDQQHKYSTDVLRGVSRVNGTRLTPERLETIHSKVEQNLAEIKAIRSFDLEETIEPATIFLAKL
jgi:DNA polymerase III delta subunit